MVRFLLTALSLCWATHVSAACSGESYVDRLTPAQQADIDAVIADTPYANGLLWDLTRDDQTLTLVGTMHVYDPRLTAIFDAVAPALRQADLLLVEATQAEMTAMQEAFAADPSLYLITEGPTLPDLLAPDVWGKVQEAASARGIPPFMVAQMQPWYLALTLGIPACAMTEIAAGQQGLDHMLTEAAAEAGVQTAPLEDWNTLIAILTDGTQEEQITMMKTGLIGAADQQALFVAMLDAYFSEQIAAVWEISTIAAKDLSGVTEDEAVAQMLQAQDALLDTRNRNWLPVIATAAKTHDAIVVARGRRAFAR